MDCESRAPYRWNHLAWLYVDLATRFNSFFFPPPFPYYDYEHPNAFVYFVTDRSLRSPEISSIYIMLASMVLNVSSPCETFTLDGFTFALNISRCINRFKYENTGTVVSTTVKIREAIKNQFDRLRE